MADPAARGLAEPIKAAHRGLRHVRRHPALPTGFLTGTDTGLTIDL